MTDNRPIGYWLRHLHNLLEEQFEATLGDLGLGRREWQVLHTLTEGPRTTAALRDALAPFAAEEESDVDGVLAGLRARGWVRSEESDVALTEAGRSGHDEAAARVGETRKALLNGRTGQQYTDTVRVLSTMAANVETQLAARDRRRS
ncbi:MAG TPA: MarR family transcriptional regulator [Streptomyces sp.]|nr:MarR family transcriptional regulator [Streptomyces sp.]